MNEHQDPAADDSSVPEETGDPPVASSGPGSDALAAAVPAFAELAMIILGEPLGVVLARIAQLAQKIILRADEASITLIQGGRPQTVAFAGNLTVVLDERQYQDGFGPCTDAAITGQTIMIEDTARGDRYSSFCQAAHRVGVHHTLSVGMTTVQGTSGALNLYGTGAAGPFDQDDRDIATTFAGYAGVAVLNAATHAGALLQVEQMREAMASRSEIEQAKGILIGRRGCTPEEAFAILVTLSSNSNRKLRNIAHDIVLNAQQQPQ